jgi:hypothetical protein
LHEAFPARDLGGYVFGGIISLRAFRAERFAEFCEREFSDISPGEIV